MLHDQPVGDVIRVVHGKHGDELKLIFLKLAHFLTVGFEFHPKYTIILLMVPGKQWPWCPLDKYMGSWSKKDFKKIFVVKICQNQLKLSCFCNSVTILGGKSEQWEK